MWVPIFAMFMAGFKSKKLKSISEAIILLNDHFLNGEKIEIIPQLNGGLHLIYCTKEIFITKKGKFSGACNHPTFILSS